MKTTTTMTCLLAALSGLATAQNSAPGAAGGAPMPPPHDVPGLPGQVAVPTFEAGRMGEPIRWTYHKGGESFNEPVRSGPVAFLGVSATPPPRELSAHLPIDQDTGLMIEVVEKDSPAALAGLQASDVLTKLDDQVLIHPRQLSVLVANKKEGDTVKLAYLRKGELHETSAVLGIREVESKAFETRIFKARGAINDANATLNEADVVLENSTSGPLRTFVRRFDIPGGGSGGEVRIAGGMSAGGAGMSPPPPAPPIDDVKKELAEIRAMLEALQQKMK